MVAKMGTKVLTLLKKIIFFNRIFKIFYYLFSQNLPHFLRYKIFSVLPKKKKKRNSM